MRASEEHVNAVLALTAAATTTPWATNTSISNGLYIYLIIMKIPEMAWITQITYTLS